MMSLVETSMQTAKDKGVQMTASWLCTWPWQTDIRMTWAMGDIWERVTPGLQQHSCFSSNNVLYPEFTASHSGHAQT